MTCSLAKGKIAQAITDVKFDDDEEEWKLAAKRLCATTWVIKSICQMRLTQAKLLHLCQEEKGHCWASHKGIQQKTKLISLSSLLISLWLPQVGNLVNGMCGLSCGDCTHCTSVVFFTESIVNMLSKKHEKSCIGTSLSKLTVQLAAARKISHPQGNSGAMTPGDAKHDLIFSSMILQTFDSTLN